MGAFFKQKLAWIALAIVAAVVMILCFANLGSTVSPTPQDMPVALVNLDEGATVPGLGETNFGNLLEEKMLAPTAPNGQASPLVWTNLDSEQEALDALDQEQYYAAVVLPADMSGKLLSLQSPTPQQAGVKVLLNQGMNYTGATVTGQILDKMLAGVNQQLRDQMLAAIKGRGDALNTAQAAALAAPLTVTQEIVHPVGAQSSNGNAPVVLSQMIWFGSMIGSLLMFLASGRALKNARRRLPVLLGQLLGGLLAVVVAVFSLLLIAYGLLDLEVPDFWELALFLLFAAYCFFLLQTTLLSWLGLRGMPILVLIFFFSLPVLALPEQFLPAVTRDWLLSWVPLRFAVEGIRDILYFGEGVNLAAPAWTLAAIGAGGLVLILLSGLKKLQPAQGDAQLSQ